MLNANIRRCAHIKTNGTQCGAPAARANELCHFHWRADTPATCTAGTLPAVSAGNLPADLSAALAPAVAGISHPKEPKGADSNNTVDTIHATEGAPFLREAKGGAFGFQSPDHAITRSPVWLV